MLHGGGNTSVKRRVKNTLGEEVEESTGLDNWNDYDLGAKVGHSRRKYSMSTYSLPNVEVDVYYYVLDDNGILFDLVDFGL